MNEAVLHTIQLVDILHDGQTLLLHKTLDKSVSAEGNTKTHVSLRSKAPRGEHRAKVQKSRGAVNDVMGCLMCDVSGDAFEEDLEDKATFGDNGVQFTWEGTCSQEM